MPADAEISPLNLSISARADNSKPGPNILISLSSRIEGEGIVIGPGGQGWSLSVNGTAFSPGATVDIRGCAPSGGGYVQVTDPGGVVVYGNDIAPNACRSAALAVTESSPPGEYTVRLISATLATVMEKKYTVSATPQPSPGPVVIGLPAPPVLDVCEFPALSWNFIEVMAALAKWIMCTLRNILAQVAWIVAALAALIPQALAALAYFLSLKWIDDLVKRLIAALDPWIDGVIDRLLDRLFKEWP